MADTKSSPGLGQGCRSTSYRADEGNRTPNLLITNQLLCQLSYVSICSKEAESITENQVQAASAGPLDAHHFYRSVLLIADFPPCRLE